jgi:dipeptidyl aminopeptidase/acylaminoacyl peptidase
VDDVFVHLAFSGDGRFLAGWGTTIRLWQVGGWKQLRHFGEQPGLRISSVALSPDGRMLASGSAGRDIGDESVHLWEIATGSERCRLAGHQYTISSIAFSPDATMLASGSKDGTALIWDLKHLPQEEPAKRHVANEDLEKRWGELADSEAPRAFRAIRAFVREPEQTVPFLKSRLQPVFLAEPPRVHELIATLDSDRFKDRQEATEELAMQVELVEPALRQTQSDSASAEVRRRLEQILRTRERDMFSPRQLQMLRGIEVLENIGSKAASRVLEPLAQGTPQFQITQAARASLDRLAKRNSAR